MYYQQKSKTWFIASKIVLWNLPLYNIYAILAQKRGKSSSQQVTELIILYMCSPFCVLLMIILYESDGTGCPYVQSIHNYIVRLEYTLDSRAYFTLLLLLNYFHGVVSTLFFLLTSHCEHSKFTRSGLMKLYFVRSRS